MKLLIKLVLGILGLVILAIGGLTVYLGMFFDPNDYKDVITEQARTQANMDLAIEGEIDWSVFPWLGLAIGKTSVAPADGEQLASIESVQVGVKLVPLFSGNIEMKEVVLDGLNAKLLVDKEGKGNWEGLGGESAPEEKAADETADESAPGTLPTIDIAGLRIRDANLTYDDQKTGQKVELRQLDVQGKSIRLAEFFPLELSFRVDLGEPKMAVDLGLNAEVFADPATEVYRLRGLKLAGNAGGEPFSGKSVEFGAGGELEANLKEQVATLKDFFVTAANLRADIGLTASKIMQEKPELDGKISVPAFSVKKLLAALGQPAIETTDSAALEQVRFSANLKGAGDSYAFNGIQLGLDDTTISGNARVNAATQAVFYRLKGDSIDVDRYLPPASEAEAATAETAAPAPGTASAGTGELIPVETLKTLDIDGEFGMGSVKASGITISTLASKVLAKGGLVQLQNLSGNLYDGSFQVASKVDVRGKTPSISTDKKVTSIQVGNMLKEMTGDERVSGAFNLDGNFMTRGNSVEAFMSTLTGPAQVNLAEGKVAGFNLSRAVCMGLAQINKQPLPSTQWPPYTSIDKLGASVKFTNGVGTNNDLTISTGGMQVTGSGQFDLGRETLDYRTEVKVVGSQIGEGSTACQVEEKYRYRGIPMRCKGSFSDDPAGLCKLDFAAMIKGEAKRAVQEKIDEKVGGKLKEKLGDQLGDDVTNKLKGLFGR